MIQYRSVTHSVMIFQFQDERWNVLLDSIYKLFCGCCGLTPAISQVPGSHSLIPLLAGVGNGRVKDREHLYVEIKTI